MKKYNSSFIVENVYCHESGITVGPIESKGPLSKYFDLHYDDLYFGEQSFEKAEIKMFDDSLNICLKKNKIKPQDVDLIVYSDLNNQVIVGSYCLRNYCIPAMGIYNACSGFTESIIIASQFLENKTYNRVLVGLSSHNGTSERQFRYPNEYGGKKSRTTTYTVTSSNILLLSNEKSSIKVSKITIGQIFDNKIKDPSDMGRSMAIAAYETLIKHLEDFNVSPNEYDLILTGDLSEYGSLLFKKYLDRDGIILTNYNDCGLLIYDQKQRVFSGGSGCGCVGAVTLGYVFDCLRKHIFKKVLIIATGALHNPVMLLQKETIPSIAHAVCFESV